MADTPEGVLRCGRCEWERGVLGGRIAAAYESLRSHWEHVHGRPKVQIDERNAWDAMAFFKGGNVCHVTLHSTMPNVGPTAAEVARWWATQAGYEVEE